jgi:hypothetical protein
MAHAETSLGETGARHAALLENSGLVLDVLEPRMGAVDLVVKTELSFRRLEAISS